MKGFGKMKKASRTGMTSADKDGSPKRTAVFATGTTETAATTEDSDDKKLKYNKTAGAKLAVFVS